MKPKKLGFFGPFGLGGMIKYGMVSCMLQSHLSIQLARRINSQQHGHSDQRQSREQRQSRDVWLWYVHILKQLNMCCSSSWKSSTTCEAEADAVLEALSWIGQLNMQHVTIELDCKIVVDSLDIIHPCKQLLSLRFLPIKKNLPSLLSNVTVHFTQQQTNRIGHHLQEYRDYMLITLLLIMP